MTRKFLIFIHISSIFLISGCESKEYYKLVNCFDSFQNERKCDVPAKFHSMEMCRNYILIYNSGINYEELRNKGTTLARHEPNSKLKDSVNAEIYCEKE